MPLLDPLHPVQSAILETLGKQQGISIALLHKTVTEKHQIKVSLPNLYRTVGQMIEAQMLVKEAGKLSLNFVWITHQTKFADNVRQTYFEVQKESSLPERDGDRLEFSADSLAGLDPIWNDLLLRISAFTTDDGFYEYVSHPYFYLGKNDTETRFHQGMIGRGIPCYTLHGNDTFLDRYGSKLVILEGIHSITKSATGLPEEGYVLSLFGDMIVECVFPEAITKHFAVFFKTIQSIEQFDPELFSSIFNMRARCKLIVRKSKKDAEKLKEKIAGYFAKS